MFLCARGIIFIVMACRPALFFVVLMALLLAAPLAAAATDLSLLVSIELQASGNAHVKERYNILLADAAEIEEFNSYRVLSQNTLTEWRRFSRSLKYHVVGDGVPLNPKMTVRRLLEIGARSASIELDYDVVNIGLTKVVSPRVTQYTIDNNAFSFDLTASKELILPSGATIELLLPPTAVLNQKTLSPEASEVSSRKISWKGQLTGKWRVEYAMEKPLGDEVREYFDSLITNGINVIPVALPIVLVLLVGLFLANTFLRERS